MTQSRELPDTIENGADPRPGLRRLVAVLTVLVLVGFIGVSTHRTGEQRRERASFDQLLALATAGETSVESAQSQAHDVAQYAEPLLNSSLTPTAVRNTLYAAVTASARQGEIVIDTALNRLIADPVGKSGRLRAARAATITYLSSWAAVFARAAGAETTSGSPSIDLVAQQSAASVALQKAAPDRQRASNAATALGATGS